MKKVGSNFKYLYLTQLTEPVFKINIGAIIGLHFDILNI